MYIWKAAVQDTNASIVYLANNPLYTEYTLPHSIFEESNFNFRYVRLWDLHIPRENG